ncbi:hypothetical protein [Methylobacterium sp. ID0610]|uniref:hypothetical protein n=1 Tax=Methylobacterium carpenticola TaxID=3344827 RepID=UPI0036B6722E
MIIVDARVAVTRFVAEPDSRQALALFPSSDVLMSPERGLGEIGEVLVRHCRRDNLTIDEVRRANRAGPRRLAASLAATPWRSRVILLRDRRDPGTADPTIP